VPPKPHGAAGGGAAFLCVFFFVFSKFSDDVGQLDFLFKRQRSRSQLNEFPKCAFIFVMVVRGMLAHYEHLSLITENASADSSSDAM
jgi:hypothetical protein